MTARDDNAAAPFLFLGSQTPLDPHSGTVASRFGDAPAEVVRAMRTGNLMIDAPAEKAMVQTWRVLANVLQILQRQGLGPQSLVHQRFFLRDIRDLSAVLRAMALMLPEGCPSTTIVEADGPGVDPMYALHADFVVLAPGGSLVREDISIPALDACTAPFPVATRAGSYIFTTPIAGVDLATGAPVTRFDQLDAGDRELAGSADTGLGEALAAQQVQAFRHIDAILRSQGSSLAWQIRQNGWLRIPMRDFGPASAVRARLFSGANAAAFTSLTVSALRDERALFEYGAIALVPPRRPDDVQRSVPAEAHGIASYYVGAVAAGPYVFTAGEVPVDATVPRVIESFADVGGDAWRVHDSRIGGDSTILAQAHYVYQALARCLESFGASMVDVVHQTVYLVDCNDCPAVERVASGYFGAELPPTTVVPITSTSPYAQSRLEVELIADSSGRAVREGAAQRRTMNSRRSSNINQTEYDPR